MSRTSSRAKPSASTCRSAVISSRSSGRSRPRKNGLNRLRGSTTSLVPNPVSIRISPWGPSTNRLVQVNRPRSRFDSPSMSSPPSGHVDTQLRKWTRMLPPRKTSYHPARPEPGEGTAERTVGAAPRALDQRSSSLQSLLTPAQRTANQPCWVSG